MMQHPTTAPVKGITVHHTSATDATIRIPAIDVRVGDKVLFGTVTGLTYVTTSSRMLMTVNGRDYVRDHDSMVTILV